MKRITVVRALAVGLGLTPLSEASARIAVFINGIECMTQCGLDTNSNLLINVGTISQDALVHIFSTSSQESVGFVTIRGSSTNGSILKIQVCGQSTGDAYAQGAEVFLAEGFHNFGGLRVEGPNGPNDPDTSLLDHSALTLAIAGDVTGNVEVGQIHRFDVLRDVNTNGGSILGEVTTKREVPAAPPLGVGTPDVAYLRAENLIAGNIVANRGPITKIVVGPDADPVNGGIRGNIVAVWAGDQYTSEGAISSVFTTGPLGAPTDPIEIQAFIGIAEVLARVEGDTQTLARDFHVDLDAGDMNASVGSQGTSGRLTIVDTSGDIHGSIRCGNLMAITCEPNCTPRAGVYARGNIDADIEVGNQVFGNIIGRTITGSVSIGHSIEGMIVGWDVDPAVAPYTPGVSIGMDPDTPVLVNSYLPGMAGHGDGDPDCGSWNFRNPSQRELLYAPGLQSCNDEGSYGAFIALYHAGTIEIKNMLDGEHDYLFPVPSGGNEHNRAPSIECQFIDVLNIENFRDGAVWSGVYDDATSTNPPNNTNKSDDYAHIGVANIGCMGRATHLWFDGTGTIKVSNTLMGSLYAPSLNADALVSIGVMGSAGVEPTTPADQRCGCDQFLLACPDFEPRQSNHETSPRWVGISEYSAIRIADPAGLHGQIILNANASTADPEDVVRGVVTLGTFNNPGTTFSVFAPTSGDPRAASSLNYVLPHYDALPATFGGGAVGVVPFGVHENSSNAMLHAPDQPAPNTRNTDLLTSEWNRIYPCFSQDAVLDFYGPIALAGDPEPTQDSGHVLSVKLTSPEYPVQHLLTFTTQPAVAGSTIHRHLVMSPAGVPLGHGIYRVTSLPPQGAADHRLVHAGLLTASPVPILLPETQAYEFPVKLDCPADSTSNTCNHEGEYDCIVPSNGEDDCACDLPICGFIDFNNDGLFPDTLDIDDFLSVFSGGSCTNDPYCGGIDFNNDGLFPDTLDIDAFLSVFSGGPCLR